MPRFRKGSAERGSDLKAGEELRGSVGMPRAVKGAQSTSVGGVAKGKAARTGKASGGSGNGSGKGRGKLLRAPTEDGSALVAAGEVDCACTYLQELKAYLESLREQPAWQCNMVEFMCGSAPGGQLLSKICRIERLLEAFWGR